MKLRLPLIIIVVYLPYLPIGKFLWSHHIMQCRWQSSIICNFQKIFFGIFVCVNPLGKKAGRRSCHNRISFFDLSLLITLYFMPFIIMTIPFRCASRHKWLNGNCLLQTFPAIIMQGMTGWGLTFRYLCATIIPAWN